MKRVPFADMPCPVAQTLELVGEWWTLLIVREAFLGRRRFVEFQQELGIARNVLSSRLRKLVAEGILERRASQTDAREVEYRLTPKGKDLMPVLIALSGYGTEDDVQRSREAGFLLHLTKPVTPRALETAVCEALNRKI